MKEFIVLALLFVLIVLLIYTAFFIITPLGAFLGIILNLIDKHIIHRATSHKIIFNLTEGLLNTGYFFFRSFIIVTGLTLLLVGLLEIISDELLKGFAFCIGGLIFLSLTKKNLKRISN